MNESITFTQALLWLVALYTAIVFVKTMLMYGTLPTAAGTFARRIHLVNLHPAIWGAILLVAIPLGVFCSAYKYLPREGLGFFGVYSKYRTMKDVVAGTR